MKIVKRLVRWLFRFSVEKERLYDRCARDLPQPVLRWSDSCVIAWLTFPRDAASKRECNKNIISGVSCECLYLYDYCNLFWYSGIAPVVFSHSGLLAKPAPLILRKWTQNEHKVFRYYPFFSFNEFFDLSQDNFFLANTNNFHFYLKIQFLKRRTNVDILNYSILIRLYFNGILTYDYKTSAH